MCSLRNFQVVSHLNSDCPPESGGQRDREADPISRWWFSCRSLTPALRATPPDSGGEFASHFQLSHQFSCWLDTTEPSFIYRPLADPRTFRIFEGVIVDKETFDKGLAIRRAVLGSEYVDKSIAAADDFTRPLQEIVTQYCWGEVWGRPNLERKTRSLLNLAMLSALNRPHEVKLHVRGALNNGVTKDEIREVFLQVAIYCGVPAAMDSFRIAKEVFKEMGV